VDNGNEQSSGTLLPQTFAIDLNPKTSTDPIEQQKNEITQMAMRNAANVLGVDEATLQPVTPSKNARNATGFKKGAGFELLDGRQLNVESGFELGRASLVTVFFRKARGDKNLLVPIVLAHEHPEGLGEKIKAKIYAEFEREHGRSPEELVTPRSEPVMQRIAQAISKHRGIVIGLSLVGSLSWGAINFGPELRTAVQEYSETIQHNKAEKAERKQLEQEAKELEKAAKEAAERLTHLGEIQATLRSVKEKPPGWENLVSGWSDAHYNALEYYVTSKSAAEREIAVKLYGEIGQEFGNIPFGTSSRITYGDWAKEQLVNAINRESDSALRHAAADGVRDIALATQQR